MSASDRPTYLITGGAGYLAASLVRELGPKPVRIRRMFRPGRSPAEVPASGAVLEDFEGDVTVPSDLERALDGVDVVFHLAAQTSVYSAEADPGLDLSVNVKTMLTLLELCRAGGKTRRIYFSGTVTEAGIVESLPADESVRDNPRTIYDIHKLTADLYLKHYVEAGVVRGATLRLANVYGPGPKSSRPDRGVINAMVRRALGGEPLKIYGSGEFVRDYVYVDDVARAFVLAAEHDEQTSGHSFVIASGTGHTVAQAIQLIASTVERLTSRKVSVEYVEAPSSLSPIEKRNFVGDSGAFHVKTGWVPAVGLSDGIERTVRYFIDSDESS